MPAGSSGRASPWQGGKVDEKGQSDRLEDLEIHLSGDGRQRSRARSQGRRAHDGQGQAGAARAQASRRYRLRRADHGGARVQPAIPRPEPDQRTSWWPTSRSMHRSCAAKPFPRSPSMPRRARPRARRRRGWQAPTPAWGAQPQAPSRPAWGRSRQPAPQQARPPSNRPHPAVTRRAPAPATGMPRLAQWLRRGRQRRGGGQTGLRRGPEARRDPAGPMTPV